MTRKRSSRKQVRNSDTTTTSSDLLKKLKMLSQKFTTNIEGKSVGHFSDSKMPSQQSGSIEGYEDLQTNLPLYRKHYQTILQKKQLLVKFDSKREAEFVVELFKPHLPNDIGITIIREKEVNAYQVIHETEKYLEEKERILKAKKKTFMSDMRFKGLSEEEIKKIKNADRRRYFAQRNKNKKGTIW